MQLRARDHGRQRSCPMERIDGDGRAAARTTQAGKRTRQMNRIDKEDP